MTTLHDLRRFAVGRSLFTPSTLERAIDTLGFVQADPIRAPARAQDLTLRLRVANYRAGDLEAYTPIPKRKLGYYALPLLWRDRVVGWGNVSVEGGRVQAAFGYAGS